MSFNPGGSGISGANDVALSNPANSQVLTYNSGIGKWQNAAAPVTTVASRAGDVVLSKTDVGLANVDNTSDASKNSATATLTNKTISGASNTLSGIPESAVTGLTTDLGNRLTVKNSTPELTDSTNDFFSHITIDNDSTPTSGWPDRLAFYYTGVRTGYHNEYGEMRARPAKSGTVPLRAMAHISGTSTVNLFEVSLSSEGSALYFSVSQTGAVLNVPLNSTSTITATNIGAKVTAASTAPSSPAVGDVWIDLSS